MCGTALVYSLDFRRKGGTPWGAELHPLELVEATLLEEPLDGGEHQGAEGHVVAVVQHLFEPFQVA